MKSLIRGFIGGIAAFLLLNEINDRRNRENFNVEVVSEEPTSEE